MMLFQVLRQKASEEHAELHQMTSYVDVCEIVQTLGLAIEHETTQLTFNHRGVVDQSDADQSIA